MYIEKIKINKFRVLEDIEVRFQVPDLTAVDEGRGNGDVVNVVAGVNGTGKTSLLDALYESIAESPTFEKNKKLGVVSVGGVDELDEGSGENWLNIYNYFNKLSVGVVSSSKVAALPCLVYIPSQLSFQYKAVQQLSNNYLPY